MLKILKLAGLSLVGLFGIAFVGCGVIFCTVAIQSSMSGDNVGATRLYVPMFMCTFAGCLLVLVCGGGFYILLHEESK